MLQTYLYFYFALVNTSDLGFSLISFSDIYHTIEIGVCLYVLCDV